MNEKMMKERIENVLAKMENKKKQLLLAGASCALASFMACYPDNRVAYGIPEYGIDIEDASSSADGGTLDSGDEADR